MVDLYAKASCSYFSLNQWINGSETTIRVEIQYTWGLEPFKIFFLHWIWFQDHWCIVEFHFLGNFGRAFKNCVYYITVPSIGRAFFLLVQINVLFLWNEFVFKHRSYPVPAIQSCNVYTFNDKDALSLSLSHVWLNLVVTSEACQT